VFAYSGLQNVVYLFTLNEIRPFFVLVIVAIDKNGKMCKYYRAQDYPSLGAVLAPGLVTKKGENNRGLESCGYAAVGKIIVAICYLRSFGAS
jgi:hypothetical protein